MNDFFQNDLKPGNSINCSYFDSAPLAARMRPRGLNEYIGQQYILSEGKLLLLAIHLPELRSVSIVSGSSVVDFVAT